jgi:tRNA (guanine-N7-)-methyltransferase
MRTKLKHFRDNAQSPFVFEPGKEDFHFMHQSWAEIFGNTNPIILEIGCGRGAYTTSLAKRYPHYNFIGIDVKGDRLWHGVKEAEKEGLTNVRFLRTYAEGLNNFFNPKEISEIWITFPDPRPKRGSENRRLTSPYFLALYAKLLKSGGILHVKTDSRMLYEFTQESNTRTRLFSIKESYGDIVKESTSTLLHGIQTLFEIKYRAQGRPITYLKLQKKRGLLQRLRSYWGNTVDS